MSPMVLDLVPNAPLREAFLRSPLRASDVAREMGWRRGGRFDHTRVLRVLGLVPPGPRGDGKPVVPQERMSYDNAVRLCDALGIDYHEAGV